MGVDTFLYLFDHHRYFNDLVPALDRLLLQHEIDPALGMFQEASRIITEASRRFEFPWSPLHKWYAREDFSSGVDLIRGNIPESYHGDLALAEPHWTVTDPPRVREYHLRQKVFSVIVEGLGVPWDLDSPPVHEITWGPVRELYDRSPKFEDAICAEIYSRRSEIPYGITSGEQLIDVDLIVELWQEIQRVSPPESALWEKEYFRNLFLLLQQATNNNKYRILAVYG